MQEALREILQAGLAAADPEAAVLRHLQRDGDAVLAGEERFEAERIFVLSAGKAAVPMARAVGELLGDRIENGLVVTKDDHEAGPDGFETLYASHPKPDERGVEAARRVEELVESLEEGDLLLALISGGASALLADPVPPIKLEDLKQLTSDLLKSGADIEEINSVRKHISVLKGGGLVKLTDPAPTIALLLSDVVGNDPSAIVSGPTVPDPTTLQDACEVLERYEIEAPPSVAERLNTVDETLKPGDLIFERVVNVLCGDGCPASRAAAERAKKLGYEPLILSTLIIGDAAESGALYAAIIKKVLASGNPLPPPCALVSGGEATVTVRGNGMGGPNQEFALALAVELDGVEGWAAFATDTKHKDGGVIDGRQASNSARQRFYSGVSIL